MRSLAVIGAETALTAQAGQLAGARPRMTNQSPLTMSFSTVG